MNTTQQQPEALRLAELCDNFQKLEKFGTELRRQHARIAELEAQLSAIGAGGVEPLRKQAAAPHAVQAAVPEGWKLAPMKVPDSAFAWVSGGYPAGYKAGDKRDTAVVHERAQRTWEAILNGITAPAHPAEGAPAQADALDAARYRWLRNQMLGVDFDWCGNGITALVFEVPDGCAYSSNCDQSIDTAIAAQAKHEVQP